ncbi:MAG: hypothetical protein LBG99_01640 [Propionibacteriaceae bacterium]|jgi:molybdopterin molybdotransferase|nr:hypothetical protein [Propionibacteriaceae bacterium]
MGFFKRNIAPAEQTTSEEYQTMPSLPSPPPATTNGIRDFWQHWDYLLSMVNELDEFGVSILESVGLTLDESIITETDIPGGPNAGEILIAKGSRMEPRMLAMLTAMGIRKVMARPNPRVLVLALSRTAIPASYLVAAQAKAVGASIHRLECFAEHASGVVQAIEEQLVRADLVITVGGLDEPGVDLRDVASQIGPHDFTPIAISPGGLHGFIMAEEKIPLVALPADAYASFVLTKLIVEPMVAKLMGAGADPELFSSHLAQPLRVLPNILTCVPAMVKDGKMTITGRPQGFEGLHAIYSSNALAILASEEGLVNVDAEAYYLPLK